MNPLNLGGSPADKQGVNLLIIHAMDASAGTLMAVCRSRVTITSQLSKDEAKVTCEDCHEHLKCLACGWPIPISSRAARARGRRYHPACAEKLDLDGSAARPH